MIGYWYSDSPPRDHSSAWLDYPADGVRFTIPDLSLQNNMVIDIPIDDNPTRFPQYVFLNANNDRRCYFVDDYLMMWRDTLQPCMRLTLSIDDLGSAVENGFIIRGMTAVMPTYSEGTCVRANFDPYPTIAGSYPTNGNIYSSLQRTTTVVICTTKASSEEIYSVFFHAAVDNFSDLNNYWLDFREGTVGSAPIQRIVGAWIVPYEKVLQISRGISSQVKIGNNMWSIFGATTSSIGNYESFLSGSNTWSFTYRPSGIETLRFGNNMANITVTTGLPITFNYTLSITPTEDGVIQTIEVNGERLNITDSTTVALNTVVARDKQQLAVLNNTLSAVGNIVSGIPKMTTPSGVVAGVTAVAQNIQNRYTNIVSNFSQNGQAACAVSQNLNNEFVFLGAVGVAKLLWCSDTDYINACEHQYGYTITNFGLLEFSTFSPKNYYLEGFLQIPNARISVQQFGAYKRAISAKNLATYFNRGIYFYTP